MAWTYWFFAGLLEIAWAVGLKYAHGFTRLWPTVWVLATMAGSIWLLSLATRSLPLGTAYAAWTGIGAFGAAVLGMILFQEPCNMSRCLCLGLIVAGIVGLRMTSATS